MPKFRHPVSPITDSPNLIVVSRGANSRRAKPVSYRKGSQTFKSHHCGRITKLTRVHHNAANATARNRRATPAETEFLQEYGEYISLRRLPVPHRACQCQNWQHTFHRGAIPCHLVRQGLSAQCHNCGGCKAHRLLAEGYLEYLNVPSAKLPAEPPSPLHQPPSHQP